MGAMRKKPGNDIFIVTAFMRGAAFNPGAGLSCGKVGVLFAVHGGFAQYSRQYLWDASAQMFSYEPNHSVYQYAMWCPSTGQLFNSQNKL